jgi:hypothetical protein
MSEQSAFDKILDVKNRHRRDGFDVPAVRVDIDTYKGLLSDPSLIKRESKRAEGFEFNFEDSVALSGGMEIIPDERISEPVAEDVELIRD